MFRFWLFYQSLFGLGNVAIIIFDGGTINNYLAIFIAAVVCAVYLRRRRLKTQ